MNTTAHIGASLKPGQWLGNYCLIGHLATGGMAELYLARAEGLEGFEKVVVLKRILPQYAADPEFVSMFLAEARLAATLHHHNVAQIYNIDEFQGHYFFAMEYVRGVDCQTIFRRLVQSGKSLPLGSALSIVGGAAAGLHYAHEKRGSDGYPLGIVHRDVSPSNVLVSYEGGVKVVDFGIAKAAAQRGTSEVGTLKGKISYMSPEQCRCDPVDRRSDVFSLGILLFELATMTRLFVGDSHVEILGKILYHDAPLPSSRGIDCPPGLDEITRRALARDPEHRYQSAADLAGALEELAVAHRLGASSFALSTWMHSSFGAPEPTAVTTSSPRDELPASKNFSLQAPTPSWLPLPPVEQTERSAASGADPQSGHQSLVSASVGKAPSFLSSATPAPPQSSFELPPADPGNVPRHGRNVGHGVSVDRSRSWSVLAGALVVTMGFAVAFAIKVRDDSEVQEPDSARANVPAAPAPAHEATPLAGEKGATEENRPFENALPASGTDEDALGGDGGATSVEVRPGQHDNAATSPTQTETHEDRMSGTSKEDRGSVAAKTVGGDEAKEPVARTRTRKKTTAKKREPDTDQKPRPSASPTRRGADWDSDSLFLPD